MPRVRSATVSSSQPRISSYTKTEETAAADIIRLRSSTEKKLHDIMPTEKKIKYNSTRTT